MTRPRQMAVLILLAAAGVTAVAQPAGSGMAPRHWDDSVAELFGSLPVQDGGRVKPMDTFARVELLKLSARRNCLDAYGNKLGVFGRMMDAMFYKKGTRLSPTEWLMDCLFYPDDAAEYPVFLVEDAAVIDAIGVPSEGHKRRDRYAYSELLPGRHKLMALADEYAAFERDKRTPVQSQIVNLADNMLGFERLTSFLDFARHSYPIDAPGIAGLVEENRYSAILSQANVLRNALILIEHGVDALKNTMSPEDFERLRATLPEALATMDDAGRAARLEDLHRLLNQIDAMGARAEAIPLFPPEVSLDDREEWSTPAELIQFAFLSDEPIGGQLALLAALEDLVRLRDTPAAFRAKLVEFRNAAVALAQSRGEYAKVPMERTYYKARFFQRSQWLYVACFVLVALLWLRPGSRAMGLLAPTALLVPTAFLIAGIACRSMIRARPPVTTLYETILFATAVAVAVAIALEYINRQRIAVSVGAVLGLVGLFVANKYELSEGVDTMPSLVAVLDTNFWLSVHVTTITMGYAASLLAGAIAHIYILGRLVTPGNRGEGFFRSVARMTYGVVCFAMLFSVIGTVFGGIWANESWGRFWGWDPKENGALMIVLWQLVILHAHRGAHIRDLGINVAAVILNIIVGFSWWGVNLLGVGLHSYGWTGGVARILYIFYAVEAVVALLGAAVWFRGMAAASGQSAEKPARNPISAR